MKKKNILEEHKAIAEEAVKKYGGRLLEAKRCHKYNQDVTTCKIECSCGHIWETLIERLIRGYWCAKCKTNRISKKWVIDFVESKDGTLLKDETIDRSRFITIKCNKDGNEWTTKLNQIKNKKQWCYECYKNSKVKQLEYPNEALDFLAKKNIELLNTEQVTAWSRIHLRCPKHNFEWETTFSTMKAWDSGCKMCAWDVPSYEEIKAHAESFGYVILEWMRKGGDHRRIKLRCEKHKREWLTSQGCIMANDRICRDCACENRKTSYAKIKAIVESKGGTLLTENCTGSLTKIMVRCQNSHEFKTYFDNVNQGYWCPKCPYVVQTNLYEIVKELTDNDPVFDARPFAWLTTDPSFKQRMQLDIWIPELKLAIEYDGEQHFMPIKFGPNMTDEDAQKALEAVQYRDQLKDKLIAEHPDEVKHFIRFNYKQSITKEFVLQEIQRLCPTLLGNSSI
jgi:hypothetical protein